jgi:hypothetical protein
MFTASVPHYPQAARRGNQSAISVLGTLCATTATAVDPASPAKLSICCRESETMSDEIDLGVRAFIAEHIQSVAQLELILLLHSNPHQPWSAADAAREFGLSPEMTLGLLRGLCQQGFASASDETDPQFRFAPKSTEIQRLVDQVATLYQQRRVTLVQLIYSRPVDKLQSFADAFRFRKGKEEN